VYIHLDCDEYEPDLMIRDPETGIHSILRMVPPREIKYFFTFGDHHIRVAKDQPFQNNVSNNEMDIHNDLKVNIPRLNYIEILHAAKSLITEEFMNKMAVKPRPGLKYPTQRIRPKTPWDLNNSIFARYRSDTEAVLNE